MLSLPGRNSTQGWRVVERIAWTAAIVCLGSWTALTALRASNRRHDVERFRVVRQVSPPAPRVDQSLWSPERVRAWRESLTREAPAPLGILRIPRIGLEVAVFEGTEEWTLNRAVGHIEETAAPGAKGNCGIAGHRDGFFRGLKDVQAGDDISLETHEGIQTYRVERTWIVNPEDVTVLDPTPMPALTLVTCYPFYFVGSAPQRYIVRAVARRPPT